MKKTGHPDYVEAQVSCSCGETFTTRATKPQIKVEICSKCHPFYTGGGRQRMTEGGRIERFQKKFGEYGARQTKATAEKAGE